MGVLHHKGGNGDMYCYVLEWDGGLKSQLAVIVYPTTCLPCTPVRMGIFDVPTHPELWDFVGS